MPLFLTGCLGGLYLCLVIGDGINPAQKALSYVKEQQSVCPLAFCLRYLHGVRYLNYLDKVGQYLK